jgi:Flp pilus assembly pilin Flp
VVTRKLRHEPRSSPRRSGEHASAPAALLARLSRDTRGAAYSEYVILVGVVALVSCISLLYLGVALANDFNRARTYVIYPVP